ncbi:MAG: quinone-dependent dihydroorotate dehydrogenase [Anaerolineae bacterium]
MYDVLYRHLLSRFDAERIHQRTLDILETVGSLPLALNLLQHQFSPSVSAAPIKLWGLEFRHPLGLAGGLDKDARCLPALAALGFSFIEVGTVTPQPQPGNRRPRLFRLPEDQALINRMGFPSAGMVAVRKGLERQMPHPVPVFVSLGKNKNTPLAQAVSDYVAVLAHLYAQGDAFVVNISSPNTPELRQLQTRAYLDSLLADLRVALLRVAKDAPPKPLLIKISPDLSLAELDELLELAVSHQVSGIIATNTTTTRPNLHSRYTGEAGGLSGLPLRQRSTAIIEHIRQQSSNQLAIIGVGGVFDAADMGEKMAAGASLVQAYTGFIYRGPSFVRTTVEQLQARMRESGMMRYEEIVGIN